MFDRSRTIALILGVAVAWTAVVVVQAGLASGEWLSLSRHAVGLLAFAGVLGRLAATVDNLIDDIRTGTGGRGRGRTVPIRLPHRQGSRRAGRRPPPQG